MRRIKQLLLTTLLFSASAASADDALCHRVMVDSEVSELSRKFADFYNEIYHPQTYIKLEESYEFKFYDCNYALIVETHAKPRVFGAETSFFFAKKNFEFRDSILME